MSTVRIVNDTSAGMAALSSTMAGWLPIPASVSALTLLHTFCLFCTAFSMVLVMPSPRPVSPGGRACLSTIGSGVLVAPSPSAHTLFASLNLAQYSVLDLLSSSPTWMNCHPALMMMASKCLGLANT